MGLITKLPNQQLPAGLTELLSVEEQSRNLSFSLLNLKNESFQIHSGVDECVVLLIEGEGLAYFHNESVVLTRLNWRDQNPTTFHLSKNEELKIATKTECRLAIIRTPNPDEFASRIYLPKDVATEHRGKDMLDNASYRLVRAIIQDPPADKKARLVVGEVMNFPGRWSSYPPHHHQQDEIYYYEFFPREGFGFAQCGRDVTMIHHHDLLHIPGGKDHAQVSAPGYHLYYIWAIHSVPPYTGFEFTKPYDSILPKSV